MAREVVTAEVSFRVSPRLGEVSGILVRPEDARALLVMGHGAGAGIHSPFMVSIGEALAEFGIATLRYQFPYMEQGKKRPDPPTAAQTTVRRAVESAAEIAGELPRFAGGKSFGGRMTSGEAAVEPLPGVKGLVFFGFPLHPSGKPSLDRAQHLYDLTVPLLFLQGTRDALAQLDLLQGVIGELESRTTLHAVDGADHSFRTLKRLGRTDEEVRRELAGAVALWVQAVL